jgi:hypothetical protein
MAIVEKLKLLETFVEEPTIAEALSRITTFNKPGFLKVLA